MLGMGAAWLTVQHNTQRHDKIVSRPGLLTKQRLPAAVQDMCSPDCSVGCACSVEHQVGRVGGRQAQHVGPVG